MYYICTSNEAKEKTNIMTATFTTQDFQMINDLKEFATAIKFELTNENDLKELLKRWVNHRVNLTLGQIDVMFDNYVTSKQ